MSEITWTFKPYNREVWNKSKTRVMFVGADPNADSISPSRSAANCIFSRTLPFWSGGRASKRRSWSSEN